MAEKIRFTVEVDGIDRNLFSISERKSGDLIIGFSFALKFECHPDKPEITHQKYSIHVSPESADFSTLTHAVRLSDGTNIVSRSMTDAVKKKTGFHPIFSRRCPDLSNPRYTVPHSDTTRRMKLTAADQSLAMIYSVFVGANDSKFGPQPNLSVIEFSFSHFKIVVLSQHIALPPHHTGNILHAVTAPPEDADAEIRENLRELMRGKSVRWCVEYFSQVSLMFAVEQAEWLLREIDDPTAVEYLKNFSHGARAELRFFSVGPEGEIRAHES